MSNYAPVIIPTLNRYDHLERCIESLKQNKLASETDVFISVDYPPNERYLEGYNKILEYLKKPIEGFHKCEVIYQHENLGAFENSGFLEREVLKTYDRFIFSEDDNYFSENFLSFMNYNLEKYKNDSSIYAINGYAYPIFNEEERSILSHGIKFSAWGFGTWKDKYYKQKEFEKEKIFRYLTKFRNSLSLFKLNRSDFVDAVYMATGKHYLAFKADGKLNSIDKVISVYLAVYNYKIIMPSLSFVRNEGHDGSGEHCAKLDSENGNKKFTSDTYDFTNQKINEFVDYKPEKQMVNPICKKDIKRLNSYISVNLKSQLKAWIIWLLLIKLKSRVNE